MAKEKEATVKAVGPSVSAEVADVEFERMVAYWDLDMHVEDAEGAAELADIKQKVIREIERGNATIDDEGQITYTLQHAYADGTGPGDPLKFCIPSGAILIGLDRIKKDRDMEKAYNLLGGMCNRPAGFFRQVDIRDIKFLQALVGLFLTR